MSLLRVMHFYGRQGSRYLSRVRLPGGYKLHRFHRGDEDKDPHDHPWDFWTFPLTSYYEEYWSPSSSAGAYVKQVRLVRALRWHWRPAEHMHRVLGRQDYYAPGSPQRIITLVRSGPRRRTWGFWVPCPESERGLRWVDWRAYLGLPADCEDTDD